MLVYMFVYVDDIVMSSSLTKVATEILQQLQEDFAVKDLGNIHFFLGIEVERNSEGVALTQKRCILDLLTKANMEG